MSFIRRRHKLMKIINFLCAIQQLSRPEANLHALQVMLVMKLGPVSCKHILLFLLLCDLFVCFRQAKVVQMQIYCSDTVSPLSWASLTQWLIGIQTNISNELEVQYCKPVHHKKAVKLKHNVKYERTGSLYVPKANNGHSSILNLEIV